MSAQFARAPHQGRSGPVTHTAPNAALLIDFDNVTMGIRNDLSRELKNLLNSDIIKGKVAVQRAYADWRRYPQYIVPLSEASVDLIFAPAYGSAKKNATDIRLAIDALELIFTRPEIGTYILLSGDSDFSSLVLKLKEYGKYVIGVGIRESASDLLIQNCDEYYSYNSLGGLTRTSEEIAPSHDPWKLVEKAIGQMAERGDVMRSDRLKQVMLELDSGFDEKTLGFSKFNRFLTEAAKKNLLRVRRGENGQYEVEPADGAESAEAAEPASAERSRGRRSSRSRPEKLRDEKAREEKPREEKRAERPAPQPTPPPKLEAKPEQGLDAAYALVRRAITDLSKGGEPVRDSDLKRRMLDFEPGWDESELGFSKFSRFLRQAHNAEQIDLQRVGGGVYHVTLPGGTAPEAETEPPAERRERTRRPEREAKPEPKPEPEPEPKAPEAQKAELVREPAKPEPKPSEEPAEQPAARTAAAEAPSPEPETAPAAEQKPAEESRPPVRYRRGTRRGRGPEGPPPVLSGQTVSLDDEKKEPTEPAAEPSAPKAEEAPREPTKERGGELTGAEFAAELGLPVDAGAVTRYLSNSYKGVGEKTAEALIDAFGADDVFGALHREPARVEDVLGGGRRTEMLFEGWRADYERRSGRDDESNGDESSSSNGDAKGGGGRRRGRRGGRRGKGGNGKE